LVDWLFTNEPDCLAVKATPRKTNIASIKMQEHVGGVQIERGGDYPVCIRVSYFPPEEHWLYMVFRGDWEG